MHHRLLDSHHLDVLYNDVRPHNNGSRGRCIEAHHLHIANQHEQTDPIQQNDNSDVQLSSHRRHGVCSDLQNIFDHPTVRTWYIHRYQIQWSTLHHPFQHGTGDSTSHTPRPLAIIATRRRRRLWATSAVHAKRAVARVCSRLRISVRSVTGWVKKLKPVFWRINTKFCGVNTPDWNWAAELRKSYSVGRCRDVGSGGAKIFLSRLHLPYFVGTFTSRYLILWAERTRNISYRQRTEISHIIWFAKSSHSINNGSVV